MKDTFNDIEGHEIQTSYDYQKNDGFIVEKEFSNNKVRDV